MMAWVCLCRCLKILLHQHNSYWSPATHNTIMHKCFAVVHMLPYLKNCCAMPACDSHHSPPLTMPPDIFNMVPPGIFGQLPPGIFNMIPPGFFKPPSPPGSGTKSPSPSGSVPKRPPPPPWQIPPDIYNMLPPGFLDNMPQIPPGIFDKLPPGIFDGSLIPNLPPGIFDNLPPGVFDNFPPGFFDTPEFPGEPSSSPPRSRTPSPPPTKIDDTYKPARGEGEIPGHLGHWTMFTSYSMPI